MAYASNTWGQLAFKTWHFTGTPGLYDIALLLLHRIHTCIKGFMGYLSHTFLRKT